MSTIWPRHIPPAHTPLSFSAILGAAADAAMSDPRKRFSEWLAQQYRADEVVLVDSGTHALELAIRSAHAIVADSPRTAIRVAMPTYSCYDLATAAVGAQARVELYDVDPQTLGPDLDSLARVLGRGVRVAVIAPLYGVPVDWDACAAVAAQHGAVLVEDAAQGHGASWRGTPLGSLGAISVLSFGRGKGWTGGSGGALLFRAGIAAGATVTDKRASYDAGGLFRALVQHVLSQPLLFGLASAIPGLHLGETRYHEPTAIVGMSRSAAALLLRTRPLVEQEVAIRRANGALLGAALAATAGRHLGAPRAITGASGGSPGYLRFPCLVPASGGERAGALAARRLGLGPAYPTTLAALAPLVPHLGEHSRSERYPGADALVRHLVTMPTHGMAREADRVALVAMLAGR